MTRSSRREVLRRAGAAAAASVLPVAARAAGSPRLVLDDETVAHARHALGAGPRGAEVRRRIGRRAEELLALPPKEREYEPGRAVTLPTSREILERVHTLGTMHFVTGDPRLAARAVAEIAAACEHPDWNPAHFLDTAEMAHAVALGLDWFGPAMAPAARARVVEALRHKAIRPASAEYASGAFWTKATHNWNIVCNGGLAIAALALRAEPGEAGDAARRLLPVALDSVRSGFASFAPDGGWIEGPAYWDYATRYAVYLLAALESAGIGDRGLGAAPGLAETGRFFLHLSGPSGKLFNFADSAETIRRSPHRFWLARRFGRPGEAGHELARSGSWRGLHAAWFPEHTATPAETGEPLDAHFKAARVATFRSSWDDPQALYLACKGGSNAANHAHLDLGTFVLDHGGERFACDLGPDDYALPDYFSRAQRFAYLRNASAGHNLLLVDGANQALEAEAPIILFRSTPGFAGAVVALDATYPQLAHRRGFAVIDRRWALVVDELRPSRALDAAWQMHTRAAMAPADGGAVLTLAGARLRLHVLAPDGGALAAEPATARPPQNANRGVTRLALHLPGIDRPRRIAVAFGPADAVPQRVVDIAHRALDRWGDAV
ncbi:MAG: heparinase II/III-family protein [Alphaproteobacteria bacterium]|nr:heparinase II/III-family protein [Alphaproteobacteria bacterium]